MNLPEHIGGYQKITGKTVVIEHDIWVLHGKPDGFVVQSIGLTVDQAEGKWGSLGGIYRKIPVAHQGDIDHGQELPSKFPVSSEHLSGAIAATHDEGKPPLALLPMAGIRAVSLVQAYGHKKYGDFFNFKKGIQHSRAISCAMRHLAAHMDGETVDPESGELHLAHAATRILFLIQNMHDKTDRDDRYKKE